MADKEAEDQFAGHLEKCSLIVKTWPKRKQELLGMRMEERKHGGHILHGTGVNMKGGSILKHTLRTGIVQLWEIESILLGGAEEVGVVTMSSLSQKNTIDGIPVSAAVPSNMLSSMVDAGILEVYSKE